jgi:aspartyl-tRNA synthetase
MSFVSQDDVFAVVEKLISGCGRSPGRRRPHTLPADAFDESMAKYGNDKPDLRFGLEHVLLTDIVTAHGGDGGVPMLLEAVQQGGIVKAMVVPAAHPLSRAEADKLEEFAKGAGARGLARRRWARAASGRSRRWPRPSLRRSGGDQRGVQGEVRRPHRLPVRQDVAGPHGDGQPASAHRQEAGLIPEVGSGGRWEFLWVVDPPLFEYDEELRHWVAAHHAFTRPHDGDVQYLLTDPGRVKCWRYDVVLNGFEIGGGSIRLHDPKVQAEVFAAMGISDEEARNKFGFLLDALRYGARRTEASPWAWIGWPCSSPAPSPCATSFPSPRPRPAPTS